MKATFATTFTTTAMTTTVGTVDCMVDGDWTMSRGFLS